MSFDKSRRYIGITLACFACSFLVNICEGTKKVGENPKKPAHPWNVILITISSLRADHISCFGYKRNTTPNFDAFARANILFESAFATSSWMMPAYGSIITSLYPGFHQATHIDKQLAEKAYTLAEILAEHGYLCIGFCCNPRLVAEKGFAQGFDFYDDYSVEIMLKSVAFEDNSETDINKVRTNDIINANAIRWLQNNNREPFFLFVHFYDNHWDYLPPAPFDKLYDPNYQGPIDGTEIAREPLFSNVPPEGDLEHIIALYDGEIRQTDEDLGRLLRFLQQQGFMSRSIVVVMGDHGEQFYEHGHTSHHGVFDEMIHIPLAISIPGLKGHKTIGSLVSGVDILPSILDFLGLPGRKEFQGRSFKPLIENRQQKINDYVFVEYTGNAVPDTYAVRSERYKVLWQNGCFSAYDLFEDPSEQRKIHPDDFTGEMAILQKTLQKWKEMAGTESTQNLQGRWEIFLSGVPKIRRVAN